MHLLFLLLAHVAHLLERPVINCGNLILPIFDRRQPQFLTLLFVIDARPPELLEICVRDGPSRVGPSRTQI